MKENEDNEDNKDKEKKSNQNQKILQHQLWNYTLKKTKNLI